METCIRKYADIDINNIEDVGYKNASIGKMMRHLMPSGVLIPKGFAICADAYRYFVRYNQLEQQLELLMAELDTKDLLNLADISCSARKMIMNGKMPADLGLQIIDAYDYLFDTTNTEVAVRSSAVSSHLSDAAASGLNDSFLNIQGHGALLYAIRQCFASLYTDRAVRHAAEQGYSPNAAVMAVGVQQMIRTDTGASGVGFNRHPISGSDDMIGIKAVWGLGELINHESIEPDQYVVFKPSLKMVSVLLAEKELGSKHKMMIYAEEDDESNQTVLIDTPIAKQERFVLEEKEIQHLAEWALLLDNIYYNPMCFEWGKDGNNHQLYLIQVSPYVPTQALTNKCSV